MYRRTDTRNTDPCIAGPIKPYMTDTWGFFFMYRCFFACILKASSIRTDTLLCSDTYKIQQNTSKYIWGDTYPRFGGNRTQAPPGHDPLVRVGGYTHGHAVGMHLYPLGELKHRLWQRNGTVCGPPLPRESRWGELLTSRLAKNVIHPETVEAESFA